MYSGFGCYLGNLLPQDKEKNLLFEVKVNLLEQENSKRMTITNKLPVYAYSKNQVICMVRRGRIRAAQLLAGVPRLNDAQMAALDKMDDLFESEQIRLSMELQRGDILLLNNLRTCHARTQFVDHDEPKLQRKLLRLWIAPWISCALPKNFSAIFNSTKAGTVRGGYRD